MPNVNDVLRILNVAAPVEYAFDYDNVGHLVGDLDAPVSRVLVALDITRPVIREAVESGAGLIVAHHPLIYSPLTKVVSGDVTGSLVIELIKNNISAICMHTNLDVANGGVNDIIAQKLGLNRINVLEPLGEDSTGVYGGGRYGEYPEDMEIEKFLEIASGNLGESCLRYLSSGKPVRRVAVGGGSCGGYLERAYGLGCDTLLTADIKHDRFLKARELGVNLIDAGHFSTENVVCGYLSDIIRDSFSDITVKIAKSNTPPYDYYKR
jgi:dinuclear metal center YbgI/SA1388 family protein